MSDTVRNVPGYQVADLPDGQNGASDYADIVADYQIDDDQNGVLNDADKEALEFAFDIASPEDVPMLRNLRDAVKNTPTVTLEVPGQSHPSNRTEVNDALGRYWAAQRRADIRDLADEPGAGAFEDATVAQRAAMVEELSKRGGASSNQRAAKEILETTPFHRRGALLQQLNSDNNLDFARRVAPAWVRSAAFERPDLGVTARAVRLGQALNTDDPGQNVDLLLASMPEGQSDALAAELVSRGTLSQVAAVSQRGAALKEAAIQAILDDPERDELEIASTIGGLGLDVDTMLQVLTHPRFQGDEGEIWDELAVDEWVSSGAMAPVFEAQGGSLGTLLDRSRSDVDAQIGLSSLLTRMGDQLTESIETTLVSGYRDYAAAAVSQQREALYQWAIDRRAGNEEIDDIFPDRSLEQALEGRLYESTVRNLRQDAQRGVLSEREYRAFVDAVRYGEIEEGGALDELADIVRKNFSNIDDALFDAGEDRYGYDYASVVNIFADGRVGADRGLWASEVAAVKELRARGVFQEYAYFADGRTIGTVLNLLETRIWTPSELGFPGGGGGTPDPTDPPGGGTPDPTDPPPGGGTPDPTDPPPGGGTPDPTDPPPGGGTPDPTDPGDGTPDPTDPGGSDPFGDGG